MKLLLREWTARDGTVRRYVNNWPAIVGLEVSRYNTGNIAHATVNGERISNAGARRLLNTKVWLDVGDQVHVDYFPDRDPNQGGLTADDIAAKVAEAYAVQAGGGSEPCRSVCS